MEKQKPNMQESHVDNLEELSGLNPEAMDLVNTFTSIFGIGAGLRIQKMLIESPSFLATMTQDNDGGQFSYHYNEAYADVEKITR